MVPRVAFEYEPHKFVGKPREVRFEGLNLRIADGVYDPHEDSLLLAHAAGWYARGEVLDLGCGSGIAGLRAALRPDVVRVTFADISEPALANARVNAEHNRLASKCEFVKSRLFAGLAGRKFHTILFNPPYLPTASDEVTRELDEAWNGGPDGRRLIDPFLERFPNHLHEGGPLLFLSSSLSDTDRTARALAERGFRVERVKEERYFFETLTVLRATRR
jgi:release factor glutamine methyltransferase